MRGRKRLLLLLSMGLIIGALGWSERVQAFEDDGYSRHRTLSYGEHDRQRIDLFTPRSDEVLPVVVWFHGGDWSYGSRRDLPQALLDLTGHGFAVASVGYRLSDSAYPATLDDARLAIAWLRANGDYYGLDPDRIGAAGFSSGGHLAALLATTDAGVKAALSLGAVHDLRGRTGPVGDLLDCASPEACADRAAPASPLVQMDAGDSPLLLAHSAGDLTVPPSQAQRLHDAARAAGVHSKLVLWQAGGHRDVLDMLATPDVRAFFEAHLK